MLRIGSEDIFSRMKLYEWYDERKVRRAKILLAGAGALGNEVGKNLVLSGYEKIMVVDMDRVEYSNLSRCVFFRKRDAEGKRYKADVLATRLSQLNENAAIDSYAGRIQEMEGDIKNFDVIVGCLDNIEARLFLNGISYRAGIPYVDGAIHAQVGKVQVVIPPLTSCLECGMNATHAKIFSRRFSCTGRSTKYFEPPVPSDINTASIIAGIEVQEVLKITHDMENYIKNIFYYDGRRNFSDVLELPISPACPNH